MPIPFGYTRGKRLGASARIEWLEEAIEGLEDGLRVPGDRVSYREAGEVQSLGRNDALTRLQQFYVEFAKLTGDAELLAMVQQGPRFVRVVATVGYRSPGILGGWGY